ncbi:PREDICTED: laminin subunit beta-1-like [Myotis brandtii]|uniref:laminin subunit beta-1-like n=1 Tax=Myotis brandtii TaxID=109478 RepID=UPI000703E005|nr:PREDICTED: laminin subunit beta-1-like [Myotis brandtii]
MRLLPPSPSTLPQDSENCFFCNSRERGGHGIENVISRSGPRGNQTWWQAESSVENVTIQLDLESAFYFTHLIMTFKTFRPSALALKRSVDRGRSWHVYRYFAHNCSGLFRGIARAPGHSVRDPVCDQHYSDIEPSTRGKVRPEAQACFFLRSFSRFWTPPFWWRTHTSPRFRLLALNPTLGPGAAAAHSFDQENRGTWQRRDIGGGLGQAPEAVEQEEPRTIRLCIEQGPRCVAELLHVTNLRVNFSKLHTLGDRPPGGLRGHPFYYYALCELVAGGSCLCHGHASECRPAPGAPANAEGMCRCKANVWGRRCDSCRPGHYGLSLPPSEGCQRPPGSGFYHGTSCHVAVSCASAGLATQVTGQCPCRPGFGGRTCSRCEDGSWGDPEQECRGRTCEGS